jgi:microcystin-dependent protein
MAINFPNSPSNGDIFGNYTYDTSIPGWRKTPENSASLPAGTIVQWPGATAPANWLICDGSAVSRTTYSSLFAALGVQYGSGDGSTTFNLPNLKGKVAVGLDSSQTEFDTLGETGGAKTHTLSEAEMPSHTHVQDSHNHTFSGTTDGGGSHDHPIDVSGTRLRYLNTNAAQSTGLGGLAGVPGGSDNLRATAVGNHTHTYSGTTSSTTATNQNTGGGGAHNNLQPYIVLNYIIKTSAGITSGDSELATRVGAIETTTVRSVALGGTGASTLTSGSYLKGAGTGAVTAQAGIPAGDITGLNLDSLSDAVVSSSATGQVLSYNGSNWVNAVRTGFTASTTITASNSSWSVPTLGSPIVRVTVIGGGGGGGSTSANTGSAGGTTTFNAGGAGSITASGGAGGYGGNVTVSGGANAGRPGLASGNGGMPAVAPTTNMGASGTGGATTTAYLNLTGISTVNVTIGGGGAGGNDGARQGGAGGRGEVIFEYVAG